VLRQRDDGAIEIDVQAVPRSSRDAVGEPHGDRLKLHVRAAPVEGEANEAIVRLLADVLELPRPAVTLVRGHTGKRKTLRIVGLELDAVRRALGLALIGVLACTSACESSREVGIAVLLPEEKSEYERADNGSVVLQPGSETVTFAVDGLDFSLEVERTPDATARRLELYLAEGDELLAWGSTAPFTLDGPDGDLALFLGRPGLLSTWPAEVADPDADLLACRAAGRGMLLLESDGDTSLLNEFTLEIEAGAELDAELDPTDGGLVSAADGTVVRMTWEQGPAVAWRYDPGEDRWDELEVDAAAMIGPRPGAAWLMDPDLSRLYLLGGGDRTDAIAIELVADEDDRLGVAPVDDFVLDGPRAGATALWLPTADDPVADALVVGGDDAALPIAWLASTGVASGPAHAWTDPACAIRIAATESDPHTVLCVGGSLDGQPSAAAMHATFAEGTPTIELIESFLPVAVPDPMLLGDDQALYALGEGRWFPIDRDDASLVNSEFTPLRARGGHSVWLASGATLVVGGVGTDDAALDRWQVFMPAIEP
jgi:uncharacterized protein YggU (UPF0235/DUF167 family)